MNIYQFCYKLIDSERKISQCSDSEYFAEIIWLYYIITEKVHCLIYKLRKEQTFGMKRTIYITTYNRHGTVSKEIIVGLKDPGVGNST